MILSRGGAIIARKLGDQAGLYPEIPPLPDAHCRQRERQETCKTATLLLQHARSVQICACSCKFGGPGGAIVCPVTKGPMRFARTP